MAFKSVSKGDRISEYVLLEKIGAGGFGEVWKAEHTQIAGKCVAIKIPTRPESMELIKKEAVFQHQLDHANIVRTIGLDLSHDPPYFIMELVDGRNLRQFMNEEGILPPPYAIDIAVQVLEALAYAHSRNIIHKDIKPENILVEKKRVRVAEHAKAVMHYVKITDLGLGNIPDARQSEMIVSEQARTSGVRFLSGTLFYMAPEQMLPNRAIDARGDLYSVGVCLYEMLTGELPLGMDLPSELNPVVTPELDVICKKALSVDRDHRCQSAREMIIDLHRAKEAFLIRLVQAGAQGAKLTADGEVKKIDAPQPAQPAQPKPPTPKSTPVMYETRRPRGSKLFEWSLVALVTMLAMLSAYAFAKTRKRDPAKPETPVSTAQTNHRLKIEVLPAGSEVILDDKKIGEAPCEAQLTYERHTLRIAKEFYEDRRLELEPSTVNDRRSFVVKDSKTKAALDTIALDDRAALRGLALVRQRGSLRIQTPGIEEVMVYLDGREVGVTQKVDGVETLELNSIEAGNYHIRLVKNSYRPKDDDVKVATGGPVVRQYELDPVPDGDTRPAPANAHRLTIRSTPPGATVYVNEMEKGRTPCDIDLANGSYRLHLELKYHEVWEEPIKVDSGKQTISVPLAKIRGRVSFESEPAGATIVVDGVAIGHTTPYGETIDAGQHTAEFYLEGHFKKTMPFEVLVKDQVVPVHLALQRIPQGMVSVECEITGAEVFVDDKSVGRAPVVQVKAEPGKHRVRIMGMEREVDVESGVDRKLTYNAKDLGLVLVAAGEFQYGSPQPLMNESRMHKETLQGYYIDAYELTNEKYAVFFEWMKRTGDHSKCDANEGRNKNHKPKYWDDVQSKHLCDPKMPVVGVDWYDATAYAAWASKRLPTEKEWEKAARGTDGRAYPWGNEWDPVKLNWGDNKGVTDGHETIAPVGTFESGKSPFGCFDMAGNALEWCADLYDPNGGNTRTVRGGSCMDKDWVRTWTRDFYAPHQLMNRLGFRCVVDAK